MKRIQKYMLADGLKEHIQTLKKHQNDLKHVDADLLDQLQERFPESVLNNLPNIDAAAGWLKDRISERAESVFGKDGLDYTFRNTPVNIAWINLTKILSELLNKPFMTILIPTLNEMDPLTWKKLSSINDPRLILIADNRETWYYLESIKGLYDHKSSLVTYKDTKNASCRSLTLSELARIRSHNDRINEKNLTIWEHFTKEVAHKVAKKEPIPHYFYSRLLFILDTNQRKEYVTSLIPQIAELSIEQTNNLYSISINEKKTILLVNVLLNCMEGKETQEELDVLAAWLTAQDPSLIAQNEQFNHVYSKLGLGSHFTYTQLEGRLQELIATEPKENVQIKIRLLLAKIKLPHVDKGMVVSDLSEIYRLHWLNIKDQKSDYFCATGDKNKKRPWLMLAQTLSGAKWIGPNYFQFLVFTLKQTIEVISGELLTAFTFDDFIVAETGESLIHLPSSYKNALVKKVFLDTNTECALRPLEIKRLTSALPKYKDKYHEVSNLKSLPLSRQTIRQLANLVNACMTKEGLTNDTVCVTTYNRAQLAHENFRLYLKTVSDDERLRFDEHVIYYNRTRRTAGELWNAALTGHECQTLISQYFAQLVFNYDRKFKFEVLVALTKKDEDLMRVNAEHRAYSDYTIDDDEAVRRIQILFISLLTKKFVIGGWSKGFTINFWDLDNTVTRTGNEIFNSLMELIKEQDLKHAKSVYNRIMEIIIPNSADKGNAGRSPDTCAWIKSIVEESLFNEIKCFLPQLIFVACNNMLKNNEIKKLEDRKLVHNFLNSVINIWRSDPQRTLKKSIRINILFHSFLAECSEKFRSNLLQNLDELPQKLFEEKIILDNPTVLSIVKEYLVEQLSELACVNLKSKRSSIYNASEPEKIKAKEDYVSKLNKSMLGKPIKSTMDLIRQLSATLPNSITPASQRKLPEEFLNTLKLSIPDSQPESNYRLRYMG